MLERRLGLAYAGVDAAEVADAERVTVKVVRDARERCGRRPENGLPPAARPLPERRREQDDFDRMMRDNRSSWL